MGVGAGRGQGEGNQLCSLLIVNNSSLEKQERKFVWMALSLLSWLHWCGQLHMAVMYYGRQCVGRTGIIQSGDSGSWRPGTWADTARPQGLPAESGSGAFSQLHLHWSRLGASRQLRQG